MNANLNKVKDSIDDTITHYGIKYVFVESGTHAIVEKLSEIGCRCGELKPNFWVELSWGSGDKDQFDTAINEFGSTLGEAIQNCIQSFKDGVRRGYEPFVEVAKYYNLYDEIVCNEQ